MNAQDLKNSILQLAMQGKLVPQNSNDEPVSILLEKIKKEKEKLIKEKKIKRNNKESTIYKENGHYYEKIGKKGESVCIDDEIPFDIPDNWSWCRLDIPCEIINGFTPSKSNEDFWKNGTVPWFTVADIHSQGRLIYQTEKKITNNALSKKSNRVLPKNTVLLCCTASVGEYALSKIELTTNQQFNGLKIRELYHEFLSSEYLFTICPSFKIQLLKVAGKTTFNYISVAKVKRLLIPVPPLNEQKRIVKKIEEFLPLIDEYGVNKEQLDKINAELPAKLKSSILQEAVQGKLVPQDSNDEPASVLLENIKQEKEQLIKAKKIKKNNKESTIYKEDDHYYERIGKKEPVCIDDEIPFDIPDSWEWCKLENISSNIHYGYTASAKEIGNSKLLRITDIHENYVDWDSVPFCDVDTEKLPNYKLEERDIVMARTGGTIGKSYIIKNLNQVAVFASYLIRIIPLENVYENYLKMFFESPLFWRQLKKNTKGTGQPNVNATSLKGLLVPLPPLNEQKRIVSKIKLLFDEADFLLNDYL